MSRTEKRPIVRRFVIRRHDVNVERGYPWAMRDRSRPAYLGQFPTFAAAIEAMITKLREERGLGPRIRWNEPTA